MPPDLALWITLISSNYPCLEHIFMVPKGFEPLKNDCIYILGVFTEKPCVDNKSLERNVVYLPIFTLSHANSHDLK